MLMLFILSMVCGVRLTVTQTVQFHLLFKIHYSSRYCGTGSVVDIATGYRLDGPEIESRWGARFSAPVQTGPGTHPASCTMRTRSFPGVKSGRGVTLTPHPLLVPLVMRDQNHTSTPSMGCTACTEPQCLYKGALYRFFLFFQILAHKY